MGWEAYVCIEFHLKGITIKKMSIQSIVNELNGVNAELTKCSMKRAILAKRKKALEDAVFKFLVANNLPGIKHNGVAIRLKEQTKRPVLSKAESEVAVIELLEARGIKNPEKLLEEMAEVKRGDEKVVQKLAIEKPGGESKRKK